jgi:protocatechuate 3,4-dioxygenase beta subunit
MTTRRDLLRYGIGSFLIAACGGSGHAAPTPQVDDGDDAPPADAFGGSCGATADNIEGPFYKPGAPHRAVLAGPRDAGERLVLTGTVRDTRCAPLAHALLDVWHADARGGYDNDGWGMRGRLRTDAHGRWKISTIVPGRYLNGRRYRPTHVHVKLRAANHRALTTQLYFAGDPYNDGDDFIVPSLIMQHAKHRDVRRARFDFVLASAA